MVVDNSVFVAWVMPDERPPAVIDFFREARHETITVPSVWPLEFTNALGRSHRAGRLSEADITNIMAILSALDIEVAQTMTRADIPASLQWMRTTGLSAYDASYLTLALDLSLPLATLDDKLRKCAQEHGIVTLL